MDKYTNDKGEIGVLVSPEFGTGWSTFVAGDKEFLCMKKALIEMKLGGEHARIVKRYLSGLGIKNQYLGGWDNCKVVFLPKGTAFRILEDNGYEELEIIGEIDFFTA